MFLEKSNWIWCNSNPDCDEYAEFIDEFTYEDAKTLLYISADSNYTAYLNGKIVGFGQYADFPYDKVYDCIDITDYCKLGNNRLAIRVWYYGLETTQVYCRGNAGLLYCVTDGTNMLCYSNENTLSRMSKSYMNHRKQIITSQLGYGFGYDASKEDNWIKCSKDGFVPAVIVKQQLPLRERPCKRLTMLEMAVGKEIRRLSDNRVIYDLGKEYVGFLKLSLNSLCEQEVIISYGEHIEDGSVRRIIDDRDFSVLYRTKMGVNEFVNTFRRLGCRYIEIESEFPLTINEIGIVPTVYEVEVKPFSKLNEKQLKIYEMCVETLRLCMHEHYEDCPWREQALYTMDSRNQMLCGYYAFGETRFPRANLELISKDNREDGLLSICYPMSGNLVIPSFSLHYVTACREYLEYSGDKDFVKSIYPKLQSVLSVFINKIEEGLVKPFCGDNYWNFYEWRKGLDGCSGENKTNPDLILNSLLSLALRNMASISEKLHIQNEYRSLSNRLNKKIQEVFYCDKNGMFYDFPDRTTYSQLGNSLAILCGAATDDVARKICEHLTCDSNMTPISMSMCCFKYDALLKTDKYFYRETVLEDIEKKYTPMIDFGSTTVWETEVGESDFGKAGSLCHGWSALPIYYYNKLL